MPNLPDLAEVEQGTSLWQDAWHRLRKNRLAVVSFCFLAVLTLLAVIGPWVSSASATKQNLSLGATPPGSAHWFGTDLLGRDLFVRTLEGGRVSLAVGLTATFVALTIGVLYGSISGFIGGKLDALMMRIVDILYSLPFVIFVILLMVMCKDLGDAVEKILTQWFGRKILASGDWNLILLFAAIGAVEWLTMARIVRGQVQSLRRQEFIEAAHALGLRKRRIILRHIVPNVLGVIIVYATLTVPSVMLLEAFLSYLGLGVQAPYASWGSLIDDGAKVMEEYWWMLMFPAAFFSATLFSLNFLGDGLRDALDTRASKD
ncbi:MAG: ABC transporter permease subunit [Verrucomicrobia bacterium]|nr:ABC transporter permease subunit [Verrucomicrobiota bacterium]